MKYLAKDVALRKWEKIFNAVIVEQVEKKVVKIVAEKNGTRLVKKED